MVLLPAVVISNRPRTEAVSCCTTRSSSRYFVLLAGVLGFVALGGTLAWIAKVLLIGFIILFLVSLIFGGRRPAIL